MTAATAARPPRTFPLLARVAGAVRVRSAEALVFSAATLVALVHALDDAFVLPGGGVPLSQHALAAGLAVVSSVVAIWAFPSLRPGVRAAIAWTFGVLAAVNGGRHVHHVIVDGGVGPGDVTGGHAFLAGLVLIGLAAFIPFRHRGEGVAHPVGRWAVRVGVVVVGLVTAQLVFFQVGMAIVDIHSLHRPVGNPPNAAYQTVRFTASDGVRLEGWYRPSRNGAAVLLISGGGGNRRSTLRHARMLERNGYGVLVYDPRGSGNSEGTVNSYGWGWERDAAAALDVLARRSDVRPGRVGVLGLSTGADIAIDTAARRPDVRAVVADGAAGIGYEDVKEYTRRPAPAGRRVAPLQDDRADPGPLGSESVARRPDRPQPRAAPAGLRRQAREGVGRAVRPRRRRAQHPLVPAARAPHGGAAPVPEGLRAARRVVLRRPLANLK